MGETRSSASVAKNRAREYKGSMGFDDWPSGATASMRRVDDLVERAERLHREAAELESEVRDLPDFEALRGERA